MPRIRRYADFATVIADGRAAEPLAGARLATSSAELGLALNAMVEQRVRLQAQERSQMEFVDTLQMTSSEDEAHDLIKRHTERSLPGSTAVTVLQTSNSANRLQAATVTAPDSDAAGPARRRRTAQLPGGALRPHARGTTRARRRCSTAASAAAGTARRPASRCSSAAR